MKLVVFVSGTRGLDVLHHLLKDKHLSLSVVTTENQNVINSVKKMGVKDLLSQTKVNQPDFLDKLREIEAKLFLVSGFPTIFKKEILNIPECGILNMHGGPLPQYRGGSPLNWQIINDEKKIGVSLIKMDQGIDTGPIVETSYFECEETDDINSIHKKANIEFIKMITDVLNNFRKNNKIEFKTQNLNDGIYWAQRIEIEGEINWQTMAAREVFNLIRALKPPYPGAFTYIDGEKVYFYDSIIPEKIIKSTPGRSFYLQGEGPYFMCKDRALLVKKSEK